MIPTEEEDGEAQDAWVFNSTPSHPRIVPNFASPSSLSSLEEKTRHSSSSSSHYIPGYSPHLFYSPGMAGYRALPLAKNNSTEKRSQLLKRMREPEDEIGLCRIDINGDHVPIKGLQIDTENIGIKDHNCAKDIVEKDNLEGFEKKKVDLVSVQVVTECKIIKDLGVNNFEEKSGRRTAKKKLLMEEPDNIVQVNNKSPQLSAGEEVEEEGGGELPKLSAQITDSLQVSKKEDVGANILKKGKPKKSFGVSQTVVTSSQRNEAEERSAQNLGDLQIEKKKENNGAKKRGAKKSFGKSATMVMECQGSRGIVAAEEKKEPAKNPGKWKEMWKRFSWSPMVATGFNNTSSAISHKIEECAKIKEKTGVVENEWCDNEVKDSNMVGVEVQKETTPMKERLQGKDVRLQGKESNFVESPKQISMMAPKKTEETLIADKKREETMMVPKKTEETMMVPKKREERMMAPKKRWQNKALGEDIEEKKKTEGGGEKKRWQKKAVGEEKKKREGGGEKEESSEAAMKKGWKEKAKDGECYVPPSA